MNEKSLERPKFSAVRSTEGMGRTLVKVILFASQGLSNKENGKRLDLPRQIVSKWRNYRHCHFP
jgi:hypothetical protein